MRIAERWVKVAGLSSRASIQVTRQPGHAIELARAAVGSLERIIAVGGDGTLNEVLRGILGTGAKAVPALGFVPAGTGNAAARTFPLLPLRLASHGAVETTIDVGIVDHATGRFPFLLWCGTGLDAAVIQALLPADRIGQPPFRLLRRIPHAVLACLRYARHPLTVSGFGELGPIQCETVVAVNVGPIAFAGSYCDVATCMDGRLDLLVVPRVNTRSLASLLPALVRGGLNRNHAVGHHRIVEASIDSEARVLVHIDGEIIGTTPIKVAAWPNAVRILSTDGAIEN